MSTAEKTELDLEGDIMDAALMARMTVEFLGRSLGFDEADPPRLCKQDCALLTFAVLQTCLSIEAAKDTFYNLPAGKKR